MTFNKLYAACRSGRMAVVEAVLAPLNEQEQKDCINRIGETHKSPLHRACKYQHLALAELLLEKGANIEAKNKWNQTPLYVACWNGNLEVAEMLVDKGADMKVKLDAGTTPLHAACYNAHIDVAEMLIKKGADINAADRTGKTALHWACGQEDVSVAEMLISKGADTHIKDKEEKQALECCTLAASRQQLQELVAKTKTVTPQAAGHSISTSNVQAVNPDIFISLRFGEALPAAEALKAKLEAKGVSVFVCAVAAGGDLVDEIVRNIVGCRLVVILGTKTYGKDTGVGFCTADELKYIISDKKEILLVKMCVEFEVDIARFRLGAHIMHHPWQPADEAEQRQVPEELVSGILGKLNSL
eukprot:TRINITY_DN10526_c0_g2_i6.p1 TRINITY_DN10526_c0_g2~~TRINITY_DN10526_c0_g2_i6.p1  ORF type:complete len:358 (+),score=78.27 TRINITY_DN10526_c0_g2_i6:73-1146(+)